MSNAARRAQRRAVPRVRRCRCHVLRAAFPRVVPRFFSSSPLQDREPICYPARGLLTRHAIRSGPEQLRRGRAGRDLREQRAAKLANIYNFPAHDPSPSRMRTASSASSRSNFTGATIRNRPTVATASSSRARMRFARAISAGMTKVRLVPTVIALPRRSAITFHCFSIYVRHKKVRCPGRLPSCK